MDVKTETLTVTVDIIRLDSDFVDEHLRSSASVLHDILQEQNQTEDEESGHACQQCGKLYKTARTLYSHTQLKHPKGNEEVQCTVCEKAYPSKLSLQKHVRYMHRFDHRCRACYRTFVTAEKLVRHIETCCGDDGSPCPVCYKTFYSRLALRNHINYNHPSSDMCSIQEKRQCNLCRRTFTSSRSLINHMAAIHPANANDCSLCSRTFNSIAAFRSHFLYKHDENSVRCPKCNKLFVSNQSLSRHMKKIHDSI